MKKYRNPQLFITQPLIRSNFLFEFFIFYCNVFDDSCVVNQCIYKVNILSNYTDINLFHICDFYCFHFETIFLIREGIFKFLLNWS
jgi:hypothetical protein